MGQFEVSGLAYAVILHTFATAWATTIGPEFRSILMPQLGCKRREQAESASFVLQHR